MGRARPQECMMELLTSNHIVCSRFRGNDRRGRGGEAEVQDASCRGLGCPQIVLSIPQEWGIKVVLNEGCETAFYPG
jgi:hypothetical protein